MPNRHYDISSLAARVDVGMRFRGVLERIAAVDHRFEFAGLGQLCEKLHVFRARRHDPGDDLLAARF